MQYVCGSLPVVDQSDGVWDETSWLQAGNTARGRLVLLLLLSVTHVVL